MQVSRCCHHITTTFGVAIRSLLYAKPQRRHARLWHGRLLWNVHARIFCCRNNEWFSLLRSNLFPRDLALDFIWKRVRFYLSFHVWFIERVNAKTLVPIIFKLLTAIHKTRNNCVECLLLYQCKLFQSLDSYEMYMQESSVVETMSHSASFFRTYFPETWLWTLFKNMCVYSALFLCVVNRVCERQNVCSCCFQVVNCNLYN